MRLGGLQKLTLLDFPGLVACTVFTLGCNLRCPFCHNASLVTHPGEGAPLTVEEFFAFLKRRQGLLDGVCVSGGEPFAQPDILEFFAGIKAIGYAVKTDTNGSYPERLREAAARGLLDYVAMDIKNTPEKYAATVGCDAMPGEIQETVSFLLRGSVPYEFRTTVVDELHNEADFADIGRWIAGAPRYFLQHFTDSGDLIGGGLHAADPEKMRACLRAVLPYVPAAKIRG